MSRSSAVTRRSFLLTAGALSVGPFLLGRRARAATPPSDRITLGFIGVGTMGRGHLGQFVRYSDCQVLAVCDVEQNRLQSACEIVNNAYAEAAKAGTYKGCAAYERYEELLARDDIDAVVISTPDHWHALPAIHAALAGKDVYLEKPLTRTIGEGRAVVRAAEAKGIVFQTGSQQRTEYGGKFRYACELVRNGYLGEIKVIRVGVGGPAVPCDLPEQPIPATTNWDLWVGPAPYQGYNEILCPHGVHRHFPAWRRYREFAGGGLADMGAHHFDIAQWALGMDNSGPVEIYPPPPGQNTGLKFVYANGVVMYHGGPGGVTFEGTKGTLHVDRGVIESDPPELVKIELKETDERLPTAPSHHRNWLDCIRSREKPICHAEVGHRSATVCHLANIGYWLRRPLRWDPEKERFVNDEEANALVNPPLRWPYELPVV